MKQLKVEAESLSAEPKQGIPPPPPLPSPRFWVRKKTTTDSVTNREIAKFWRRKRMEEEDHLLAAIKAAARLRARNLTSIIEIEAIRSEEEDYRRFEESLNDEDKDEKDRRKDEKKNETRVGIKDWWTKSRYAYLNQPALEAMDSPKKRASTYAPNCFTYKPAPLYPTSLGVF